MKSSLFVLFIALLSMTVIAPSTACDVGPSEGSTCNALVVDNECTGGTTCQTIGSCSATFCCPTDPTTSADPHCNGALCPPVPPDGGDNSDDASADAEVD
jgi:hypothetical protein